jgi:PAS domain S-box-containing protein
MGKHLDTQKPQRTRRQTRARDASVRCTAARCAELKRLEFTLDSIGDGLITVDTRRRVTFINRAAQQLTGWQKADALGQNIAQVFRLINFKTRQPVADPVQVALGEGRTIGLPTDTALVAKDGSEYLISSSIAPIYSHAGEITGAVLVFRDITRLRQAEYALREAQQFTASLIENSLDMIIALDQERRIIEFNPAAERTFGYSRGEVIGRDVSMLYAEPKEGEKVSQAARVLGHITIEVWNRRKNGEVFPALVSVSQLKNAAGEIIGMMGVSRDITEFKRAEEHRIRTERLSALGRMAAALAHELNNPLQAIRSTLDLMLDFPLSPEEREASLRIIHQEIERLGEVTERILRFARPTPALRRMISVAESVRQTVRLANKHLQQMRIQFTQEIQEVPPVLAAPEQIVQVFLNIILNAIEATGEGGHIHIATSTEDKWAVVSFQNDGPIIPPEEIPHIFEPFFTSKQDGTGLGLYVAQSIVQQHGGTITVENTGSERGVKFTIRLPIVAGIADSSV